MTDRPTYDIVEARAIMPEQSDPATGNREKEKHETKTIGGNSAEGPRRPKEDPAGGGCLL